MTSSVLILGGGFIGLNAAEFFKNKNWKVSVISKGEIPKLDHINYIKCDASNLAELKNAISKQRFDYVLIALGKIDHGVSTFQSVVNGVYDKYVSVINLLKVLDMEHLKKIVQMGSSLEKEKISSPYIEANKQTTYLLGSLASQGTVSAITLFLPQIYGPGQNLGRLIPDAINACLTGAEFSIKNPNFSRDYLYIGDLCGAIYQAFISEVTNKNFEVGSGKNYSVREIVLAIEEAMGKKINSNFSVNKSSEIYGQEILMNVSFVAEQLCWRATTKINDGLGLTIQSAIKNNNLRCSEK